MCTPRLHASGSLDNPVPSRFSNPPPSLFRSLSNFPPTLAHGKPPPFAAAAALVYLELYQNIITGCRAYSFQPCVLVRTYTYSVWYRNTNHVYVQEVSESWSARAIFSRATYLPHSSGGGPPRARMRIDKRDKLAAVVGVYKRREGIPGSVRPLGHLWCTIRTCTGARYRIERRYGCVVHATTLGDSLLISSLPSLFHWKREEQHLDFILWISITNASSTRVTISWLWIRWKWISKMQVRAMQDHQDFI